MATKKNAAANNEKAAKFTELATKRMAKAIKAVRQLGNLANKSNYDFSADQVDKMFKAIDAEATAVEERFKAALAGKKAAPASEFSF